MTILILICAVISVTAIAMILFQFDIDDDLREAMEYEAVLDKTSRAIKGRSND